MRFLHLYRPQNILLLLAILSFYASGCRVFVFNWQETPAQQLESLAGPSAYIYVKGAGKNPTTAWSLTPISIRQDTIIGKMQLLSTDETKRMLDPPMTRKERREIVNYAYHRGKMRQTPEYVVLTLKPGYTEKLLVSSVVSINSECLEKVEVYKYDKSASNSSSVLLSFALSIPIEVTLIYIVIKNIDWMGDMKWDINFNLDEH